MHLRPPLPNVALHLLHPPHLLLGSLQDGRAVRDLLPRSLLPRNGSLSKTVQGRPLGDGHWDLLERDEQRDNGVQSRTASAEAHGTEETRVLPQLSPRHLLPLGDVQAGGVVPLVAQLALQHVARLWLAAEAVEDWGAGPPGLIPFHLLQVLIPQLLGILDLQEDSVQM